MSSLTVELRTLHHPANPLYSIIILSHPFMTPGHFSSHVIQPNHDSSLHHVFGMTYMYHLNVAPFLYIHHRRCQSQDIIFIRILYPSPRAIHSKLKCHRFKNSYPNPSDHSPSPSEPHPP